MNTEQVEVVREVRRSIFNMMYTLRATEIFKNAFREYLAKMAILEEDFSVKSSVSLFRFFTSEFLLTQVLKVQLLLRE